jgi:hypothetical protein
MSTAARSSIRWWMINVLLAVLIVPAPAQAWHARTGGGARTFVVPPHNFSGGASHYAGGGPPPPRPMPAPRPQPMPHPPGPPPTPHPPPPPPRPYPPPPPPPPPHYHDDGWYNPWAAAAVVGAATVTGIAIGSAVHSVPNTCVPVVVNTLSYMQCGSTWYQPQYVGTNVQYIVVVAPR